MNKNKVKTEKEQIIEVVGSEEDLTKYLEYLDDLRDSGETNMFGAASYIRETFGVSRNESTKILSYWMHTFSERHQA